MRNRIESSATVLGAALLLSSCGAGQAPTQSSPAQEQHPNIGGFWELVHDSKQVTPAALTPMGKELTAKTRPKVEEGEILTFASRWCQPLGTPFIMGDSAPLDIVQSEREIAIIAEVQSSARHVYLDGRGHPDMEVYDPTTNGHSIGRWEGQTLVIETVGFNDRGNAFIPGGGVRGPQTKLVERVDLLEGSKQLRFTFTWEDPLIFEKPHTYVFTYHKSPPQTYAMEYFCDAADANRGKTAEEPPQRE
jgi:hypothetical protein